MNTMETAVGTLSRGGSAMVLAGFSRLKAAGLCWGLWILTLCLQGSLTGASLPERVSFNFHIRPLLSDRCYNCHGPDEKGRKGKLRLDLAEGGQKKSESGRLILQAGKRESSELWHRIISKDPEEVMPPKESHLTLSADEVELLGRWIDQGAEYQAHWAFAPVTAGELPSVQNKAWVRNGVDAWVLSKLEREGVNPSPEAARSQWLRRVTLDLAGVPPTTSELEAFLADTSEVAYEKVVDRLLNSPAYGERMAIDWMDLSRYADTYGYQADVDRDLSPWRDWVIRSFNQNLPYDRFLLWQLAGDLLPNPTQEQYLATAFNRLHRQTNEGGSIDEEFRNEYVSDRVHTFGTAVLGLTLECSRCHDHKYDPISQKDYYRLSGFFNNIDESGLYSHFTTATPTPTLLLYRDGEQQKHEVLLNELRSAEKRLADAEVEAVQRWLNANTGEVAPAKSIEPTASFAFDVVEKNRSKGSMSTNHVAELVESPVVGPGQVGQAIQFSGDNSVVIKGVSNFKRVDPFSIGLWIQPTEEQVRAVVLHQSRAWTDSGSRGFELVLDHGRPFFALIHFWPGNAVAIRAKESLPLKQWSHVVMTYDGSSRAGGMALYVDGQKVATEVVRDHLYRDILHRGEWGDADAGGVNMTLGGRFRDNGFKNGWVDELKIYGTELEAGEVMAMFPGKGKAAGSGTREMAARVAAARDNEGLRALRAEVQTLRNQENDLVNGVREIMVMKEMAERRVTHVLRRGAYDMPAERVEPDVPSRILPLPENAPRNRLGLAQWVVDPKNPLTRRVAVNRIWKHHFGRGLVATVEDFGAQGQLPTHPELLDWLCEQFLKSGWDRKAMHRMLVLSATYRQSSEATAEWVAKDPENRLLARGPRHRLGAEVIRDQALAVSGLLNPKVGGPSVKPYQPAGVWEEAGTGKSYRQDKGDALYRRSLYTFWRRTAPPPSMLTFDATSREVCTAKREVTTTPLQALVLMNDPQFVEASRVLAERLIRDSGADIDARIDVLFAKLTSRKPAVREREIMQRLYREQLDYYRGDEAAAKKVVAVGESKSGEGVGAADLAATTMLVSAMMNHDEFVMKR